MKKVLVIAAAVLSIPCAAMAAEQGEARKQQVKGQAATASAATRVVQIQPKTKYVYVTQNETVKFVLGDKQFTWRFDTFDPSASFPLAAIAPADVPTHGVRVYVAPNPLYQY